MRHPRRVLTRPGAAPSFRPLSKVRELTHRPPAHERPEANARQRDAPSGAKAFGAMFDTLSGKIGDILSRLTGRGALSENDVREAMREVRKALLEADVALDVARAFTDRAAERATGADVIRSVAPGQMVVKIV